MIVTKVIQKDFIWRSGMMRAQQVEIDGARDESQSYGEEEHVSSAGHIVAGGHAVCSWRVQSKPWQAQVF